jgi:hypothetical protein
MPVQMTTRSKKMAIRQTSPIDSDEQYIYPTIEQAYDAGPSYKFIKQESRTPDPWPTDWGTRITTGIDAEAGCLFSFLDNFSAASRLVKFEAYGQDVRNGYLTTAPVAAAVSSFLSSRGIKSMPLGSSLSFPSVVSVFDEGEGPCLVLNGVLSPRAISPLHPYSLPSHATSVPKLPSISADMAGTAAIVAAYAYLHSMRHNLTGTIVLEAITDVEAGDASICHTLLHKDERKRLWRGDCMITAACDGASTETSHTESCTHTLLSTKSAMHPVATSFSNNGKRVMGRRPSIPDLRGERTDGSHSRHWSEVGVPSFCFSVGGGGEQDGGDQEGNVEEDTDERTDPCRPMGGCGMNGCAEPEGYARREEAVDRAQWLQLVKVLVLTAWDYVGLEEY